MREGARLDTDEARWQLLKKRQNVTALELAANDHIACRIDAVDLKNRLCDVETDRRNRLHVWLLRIVGALTATPSMALMCRWRSRPQHQVQTHCTAANSVLFDHLVGKREQIVRDFDTLRLGRLHVDDQLEFRYLKHRQVGGFVALENAPRIYAGLAIALGAVGAITHQAARGGILTIVIDRGNRVAAGQRDDLHAPGVEEGVRTDHERSGS